MRIVHALTSIDPQTGGPAIAIDGLAPAQVVAGLQVTVVAMFRQGDGSAATAAAMTAQGVKVILVGPAHGPLANHRTLDTQLHAALVNADMVHIHSLWEQIQHRAARLAMAQRIPYIIRSCGMLDPWSLNQSKLKKRIYMALRLRKNLDRAAVLHFTTDLERDLTAPLKLKPTALVEPNGIDLAEFHTLPAPGQFRARYPQLGDRPVVMFLSRIHAKKGLDVLVPAFAQANLSDAMLVIAGPDDDGYLADVQAMVKQHGLQERVIFTGMLRGQERIAALVDADLFCLPSYQENFGIAVVEAMAAGKPVVISDQVNLHAVVTANGLGAVVPTQVNAVAAALQTWMADKPARLQAGQKARDFTLGAYDWQHIAARWAEHYAQIAQRH